MGTDEDQTLAAVGRRSQEIGNRTRERGVSEEEAGLGQHMLQGCERPKYTRVEKELRGEEVWRCGRGERVAHGPASQKVQEEL